MRRVPDFMSVGLQNILHSRQPDLREQKVSGGSAATREHGGKAAVLKPLPYACPPARMAERTASVP